MVYLFLMQQLALNAMFLVTASMDGVFGLVSALVYTSKAIKWVGVDIVTFVSRHRKQIKMIRTSVNDTHDKENKAVHFKQNMPSFSISKTDDTRRLCIIAYWFAIRYLVLSTNNFLSFSLSVSPHYTTSYVYVIYIGLCSNHILLNKHTVTLFGIYSWLESGSSIDILTPIMRAGLSRVMFVVSFSRLCGPIDTLLVKMPCWYRADSSVSLFIYEEFVSKRG